MTYSVGDFRDDVRALKRKELLTQFSVPTFTGNTWTSSWTDAHNYGLLKVYVAVNQNLAVNGVEVEFAPQGASSNSVAVKTLTLGPDEVGQLLDSLVDNPSRWFRLKVTHNGVAPTVFEAHVLGEVTG